jgi:hypothetical protein
LLRLDAVNARVRRRARPVPSNGGIIHCMNRATYLDAGGMMATLSSGQLRAPGGSPD